MANAGFGLTDLCKGEAIDCTRNMKVELIGSRRVRMDLDLEISGWDGRDIETIEKIKDEHIKKILKGNAVMNSDRESIENLRAITKNLVTQFNPENYKRYMAELVNFKPNAIGEGRHEPPENVTVSDNVGTWFEKCIYFAVQCELSVESLYDRVLIKSNKLAKFTQCRPCVKAKLDTATHDIKTNCIGLMMSSKILSAAAYTDNEEEGYEKLDQIERVYNLLHDECMQIRRIVKSAELLAKRPPHRTVDKNIQISVAPVPRRNIILQKVKTDGIGYAPAIPEISVNEQFLRVSSSSDAETHILAIEQHAAASTTGSATTPVDIPIEV